MQKKSNMNWQTAAFFSVTIALMCVLPLFFPSSLYIMGGEYVDFVNSVPRLTYLLYSAISPFATSFLLFMFCFRIQKGSFTALKRNIYLAAGALSITFLSSFLQMYLHKYLFGAEKGFASPLVMVLETFFWTLIFVVIVYFISYIIYLSEKRQQMDMQYKMLQVENMQIRYEALKNQLNPHFLFNTMSILDSLVDEDRQRTHEYIQRFSSVYRYILQNREVVTLGEELGFVDNYFGLLKVRYGEALTLKLEIDPMFKTYSIVPLGLQVLVENAVQHNIISHQKPLSITICTTPDREIVVCNNFQPKPMATSGAGIGLANLLERYRLKWQRDITIEQTTETFRVSLPLVFESPKNK